MHAILKNKIALVYGAGPIGTAVSLAFANEGATIFIADLNEEAGNVLVKKITEAGGHAEAYKVDALNKDSVETFVAQVAKKTGRIDITFNAINVTKGGQQGTFLRDLDYEDFALPITVYVKTQFLTANAASRYMVTQGSGVIMMITAIPSRMPVPGSVGFGVAWAGMEALSRTLAVELGQYGVRTVCLNSTGSPETADSIGKTFNQDPKVLKRFSEGWAERSKWHMLVPNAVSLDQVGAMAAFMASDKAGATTGTIANMSAGMVL
ncbi:MAG TPA: SDR family oxidoreductase [Candidatus Saccharimonadales bacterium]|nr:SDR family oxidoreductase [Candidatus Saccharimonadales bacterium]